MSTSYYFKRRNHDELMGEIRNVVRNFKMALEVNHELPDFYINDDDFLIDIVCCSGGWKPLFSSNKYFSNWNELFDFYKDNGDDWMIIDEYENELYWVDLMEVIGRNNTFNGSTSKPHTDCEYYTVKIDEYGNEWKHNQNVSWEVIKNDLLKDLMED